MSLAATSDAPPSDQGTVRFTRDGAVAHLVFDRPAARNAMTWRMYEELAAACAAIAEDRSIRVAVLRGAGGKAFVAGTDIEQFRSFTSGDDGIAYEAAVERYVGALETLPVPTIAVVEGWAVGGGMMLANACDFRLATPGARFGVPIARTLGNCLSANNLRRLTSTLGAPLVRRMLLCAETPPAEEMPAGYVAVAPAEAIDDRGRGAVRPPRRQCADHFARHPRDAAPPRRGPAGGRCGPVARNLWQRRFPRGRGGLPRQAPAGLAGAVVFRSSFGRKRRFRQ